MTVGIVGWHAEWLAKCCKSCGNVERPSERFDAIDLHDGKKMDGVVCQEEVLVGSLRLQELDAPRRWRDSSMLMKEYGYEGRDYSPNG